ncbi:MAG: SusC/RagA family TonB-linked outer membrane protein [Bacteroidales bacterium]|nr:SusC/RagA family TonB-linked outer membrane protein [Bacteroidales bacterium]
MKKSIIFGLAVLMGLPSLATAQDFKASEQEPSAKKTVVTKKFETRLVTGQVLDAVTGQPLEGALVYAAGVDGYSELTDENGRYELQVPLFCSSLQVKNPDYNMYILGLVKDKEQKTVRLYSSSFKADYTQEPNLLNSRSLETLDYTSSVNAKDEIGNQLGAYVYTTSRSAAPGIGSELFVQGLNSLSANAQPLVVVDGVILEQQYDREVLHSGFFNDVLTNINPEDIEDVTVLRNGTALYGTRGSNGVILISTKRSRSMTTKITASVSGGVTTEPKFLSMMDAEEYRGYASGLLGTTNTTVTDFKFLNADPTYYYYKQYHNNTDWKDKIYQTAFQQNYGIKVEGGDDIAQYNLSVGFTRNESALKYNDMNRLSVRFNTDIKLLEKLKVRFDVSFSNINRDLRDDGAPTTYEEGTPTAPSFLAYAKAPFLSPYAYGNGVFSTSFYDISDEEYLNEALSGYRQYNYKLGNPVAFNKYGEAENKNHFENSLFNIAVTPQYAFLPNLVLSEQFSYTLVNTNNKYYVPINGVPDYWVTGVSGWRTNEVRSLASKQNSVQSDTRLTWNQRFGAHKVDLLGGIRINWENYTRNSQWGYDTGSDKTPFISSGLKNASSSGDNDTWRNMDVYLQGNYNYAGRYYLQANLTGSGSSRFGKKADGGIKFGGVKWGIFPSVQATWVLSNEAWLAGVSELSWLDKLSLTAGYDVSGNDGIGYNASRTYFAGSLFLNRAAGLTLEGIANEEVKWETTSRFNVGMDAGLFNNRVKVGASVFFSKTQDLLTLQTLPYYSGLETYWTNDGELENRGFDVSASVKLLSTRNWSWEMGATVGHYENKINKLASGVDSYTTELYSGTVLTKVGKAANLFYGYKTDGVFASTAEANADALFIKDNTGANLYFGAGDMRFVDQDGNHEINEDDRVVIGNPNPDIYGNIFTTASYKHFHLNVNFKYSLGNDVYNYMRSQLEGGSRFMNQTKALTNRWQYEGQETSVPKATFQDPMGNSRFSDRWIEDGSYLKLKSVTLSYDLPLNLTFLQGLQFWVQANNLFTATKYLGSDPEVSCTNAVIGQGIDAGYLGGSRSFMAGVKINL